MAKRRQPAGSWRGRATFVAAAAASTMMVCTWQPFRLAGRANSCTGNGCAAVGAPPPPVRQVAPLSSEPESEVITTEELKQAAKRLNVELRENVVGPWYQMELYSGDGRQLGKTSGWAQPWGILHLETIEVRRFTGYWVAKPPAKMGSAGKAQQEAEDERKRYADVSKVSRWFGLLLSVSIGCWNRERAPFYCKEAHLLAIKDEEKQHERLVRYYKSLGFEVMREDEDLSLQDQVTWGGSGTLMNVLSDDFMRKWTPVVRALAARGSGSRGASTA